MSEPFIGEMKMFAGNFAPRSWAFCDGQLLAVSQNEALFSLLGTIYGGDGRRTFGLPDMRGRIPIHVGNGPGLSPRSIGGRGGAEREMLTVDGIPPHTHAQHAATQPAGRADPSGALRAPFDELSNESALGFVTMASDTIGPAGGDQAHSNLQPFLCVNFIIALFGIYPSRN